MQEGIMHIMEVDTARDLLIRLAHRAMTYIEIERHFYPEGSASCDADIMERHLCSLIDSLRDAELIARGAGDDNVAYAATRWGAVLASGYTR